MRTRKLRCSYALAALLVMSGCSGRSSGGSTKDARAPRARDADGMSHRMSFGGDGTLAWPTPAGWRLTSRFGVPRPGHRHAGIDIAIASGTPIFAVANGTVRAATVLDGYGNVVILDHGNGYETRYAHNTVNLVADGARVERGTIIALVGSTGASTGPHVHFEVRRNDTPMNPLPFYGVDDGADRLLTPYVTGRRGKRRAPPPVRTQDAGADEREDAQTCNTTLLRTQRSRMSTRSLARQEWLVYGYTLATCTPAHAPWRALRLSGGKSAFVREYVLPFADGDWALGQVFAQRAAKLHAHILRTWDLDGG